MCQSLLNPLKAMGTQLCRPEALGLAPAVCLPSPNMGTKAERLSKTLSASPTAHGVRLPF